MADDRSGRSVPTGRLSRFGRFGRMAGGVAGSVMAEGARRLAAGERPRMSELLLTPANAARVADQLSHLRGAAMKLGQMISMDAGDLLPPEFTRILARLRDNAHHMPPPQLDKLLTAEWGRNWRLRFRHFQAHPIAAASIGQVHRAELPDGRVLAIKVQYPGVASSIDADVDNVSALLRISGLLPRELDVAPLLAEAKRQLHQEADYRREFAMLERYRALIGDDPAYLVPAADPAFSTPRVLAMDFIGGERIEALEDRSQDERDKAATALVRLVLRELFAWGIMQTDPNFANYRWQAAEGRLVLLDFGAARVVLAETRRGYHDLLMAALAGDRDGIREAATSAGFVADTATAGRHRPTIDRMIDVVLEEFNRPGPFDFGDRAFVAELRDEAMAIAGDRATWHLPPIDALFVQRKVSGTALLCARLKARVDVRGLVEGYRGPLPVGPPPALAIPIAGTSPAPR